MLNSHLQVNYNFLGFWNTETEFTNLITVVFKLLNYYCVIDDAIKLYILLWKCLFADFP